MKFLSLFLSLMIGLIVNLNADPLPSEEAKTSAHPPKNYFEIKVDDKEGDRFLSEFINMMTTLGIIVAIILIATWFLKKMMNTRMEQLNTTSEIKIIEKRLLTPKTSLYLIDIHGTGFILAESLNGVTSLGSFNVNEMENSNGQEPFNKLMENRKENRPNV